MTVSPLDRLNADLLGDLVTDELNRCLLATDASIFSVPPLGVAYPKNTADVARIVRFARDNGFSVHGRGAGSGLCGAALGAGIVVDFTRYMNRLVEFDPARKIFICEPGYRLGELEQALSGSGLFFPPDPSSGEYATFGGMYATNASGAHSVKYGNVADYIEDAQVVLGTGQVIRLSEISAQPIRDLPQALRNLCRLYVQNQTAIESAYPSIRFNSSGYNLRGLVKNEHLDLRRLLAGSEGTLGISTRLTFRLLEQPAAACLVIAYFDDIERSARAVEQVLPLRPAGIEIMDKSLLQLARENQPQLDDKIPSNVDNVLLIEFDAPDSAASRDMALTTQRLLEEQQLSREVYFPETRAEEQRFWAVRKAAVPILYKLKGRRKILALIEDAAVPTDQLVPYIKGIYRILEGHRVRFVLYGHIAKGLLHTRPLLDLKAADDVALLKTLADEIFTLVSRLGGAISGEHGDGRLRSAYIRQQYTGIYPLFEKTKRLLDPDHILNPDILHSSDPFQMQKQLRFGPQYRSRFTVLPNLNWPDGIEAEIESCHGCSKCTTVTTATRMCPVYQLTRREAASPKAKANSLRALITGKIQNQQLYARAFQEVMQQCVQCGSCQQECPSNVNIPKLALEARSHYRDKYGITLHDVLITGIETAGRTTRKVSPIVAGIMGHKRIKQIGQRLTGISARRDFQLFDKRSLAERIPVKSGTGTLRVLFFAGCYAGYVRPEIGVAAVKVLNRCGIAVITPKQHCCGLPMLSKGMVPEARRKIRQNMERWQHLLREVDRIVVTCSSCGLTLRQEWGYLLRAPAAQAVQDKVVHISHLVSHRMPAPAASPPALKAAYHMPCHLKVQPEAGSSLTLLSALPGLGLSAPPTRCCGMAGAWGMAASNDLLSRQIGADMVEKLIRSDAGLAVTDCPTCRMQIEQLTPLAVKHPVELVAQYL